MNTPEKFVVDHIEDDVADVESLVDAPLGEHFKGERAKADERKVEKSFEKLLPADMPPTALIGFGAPFHRVRDHLVDEFIGVVGVSLVVVKDRAYFPLEFVVDHHKRFG